MAKTIAGVVLFGTYRATKIKKGYTDEKTGTVGPPSTIFEVLVPHDDGTVSKEEIKHPDGYSAPSLKPEQAYGFPCTSFVSKKTGKLYWTARTDLMPFAAPQLG